VCAVLYREINVWPCTLSVTLDLEPVGNSFIFTHTRSADQFASPVKVSGLVSFEVPS
jgi:hypothetical protein